MAKKSKKSKHGMIVTLSPDRDIRAAVRDLKAAGMTVDQVLEATKIVTGTADAKSTAKLRKVKGVADVSADHPVDIGPPDAEVQ